jgi:hypothetical protein
VRRGAGGTAAILVIAGVLAVGYRRRHDRHDGRNGHDHRRHDWYDGDGNGHDHWDHDWRWARHDAARLRGTRKRRHVRRRPRALRRTCPLQDQMGGRH